LRRLIPSLAACCLVVFALPALALSASAGSLIDPGPFGPARIMLEDDRVMEIPSETHALYLMLTENGRLYGRGSPRPSEAEAQAAIALRHQHEHLWSRLFANRPRTTEEAYVPPVERGSLSVKSGYKPGHRGEDIFAPPGRKLFAPATMLILHAGYLSKTAGEAVVGFVPAGDGQPKTRYITLVHVDVTPAKARVGGVVEAGTLIGFIARGDEAVVGNSLGRQPHVHFAIEEERADGHLWGIPVWNLLRRTMGTATHPAAPSPAGRGRAAIVPSGGSLQNSILFSETRLLAST
jgi:hypothetical protein